MSVTPKLRLPHSHHGNTKTCRRQWCPRNLKRQFHWILQTKNEYTLCSPTDVFNE